MKEVFNVMPDKAVNLTGIAFALAAERVSFKEKLVEYGVLTAEEILELHIAAFIGNTDVLRNKLNKINDFCVKEYDSNENARSQF